MMRTGCGGKLREDAMPSTRRWMWVAATALCLAAAALDPARAAAQEPVRIGFSPWR
jgi:hypothetical protein